MRYQSSNLAQQHYSQLLTDNFVHSLLIMMHHSLSNQNQTGEVQTKGKQHLHSITIDPQGQDYFIVCGEGKSITIVLESEEYTPIIVDCNNSHNFTFNFNGDGCYKIIRFQNFNLFDAKSVGENFNRLQIVSLCPEVVEQLLRQIRQSLWRVRELRLRDIVLSENVVKMIALQCENLKELDVKGTKLEPEWLEEFKFIKRKHQYDMFRMGSNFPIPDQSTHNNSQSFFKHLFDVNIKKLCIEGTLKEKNFVTISFGDTIQNLKQRKLIGPKGPTTEDINPNLEWMQIGKIQMETCWINDFLREVKKKVVIIQQQDIITKDMAFGSRYS